MDKQQWEDSLLAERLRKPRFDSPYGLTQVREYRVSLHNWFKEYAKLLDEIEPDVRKACPQLDELTFGETREMLEEFAEYVISELASEERMLSNDDDYEAEELE